MNGTTLGAILAIVAVVFFAIVGFFDVGDDHALTAVGLAFLAGAHVVGGLWVRR